MTVSGINAVGFCATYTPAGDWAFDYALNLSKTLGVQLNVFHFLSDPYDPNDTAAQKLSGTEREKLAIERERELRLYYDQRAGEYLDVGFRLCENNEWTELHRCLRIREFQVLVLGYVQPAAMFSGKPIEDFADAFVCPVVLVGPENRDQYRLNTRAELMADRLGIPPDQREIIRRISA
jgi:hypothetical protein